ncbi:ABC transporter substrate-binding protein [Acidisoma silvae]|uniref:ABC transporter substrate-binding protein n=1 Tax=Acidisoma silvae TaxID=2802396 RepID=A0A964DZW2_9PROT|nr:ABC transporter substrate-binding protein [Acidisoma silvae]MCB8876078.1 ABC transporter substrate-binding protein [Acidisoma silvae]
MKLARYGLSQIALGAVMAATLGGTAMAKDITTVGITVGSLGNPYFAATDKGIEARSKEITPGAKTIAVSSDYDLNKQFTQIDNFIAAGAQVIMVNAADPVAIAPALMKAHNAGIAIGAFDVAATGADVTVMTDNVKAGSQACQYIVDHLPGKAGNVVIANGPQVSSVIDRVKGCEDVLKTAPGIKILSDNQNAMGSRDGGFSVGQSLLTRFPKVDAVFAINDPTAIGFELAAKQQNRKEFFITSVDGAPDIVPEIKNKDGLIKASSAQDPYGMAGKAYAYAVDVANGKAPPAKVILLAPTLITIDNVDSYKGWDPTAATK